MAYISQVPSGPPYGEPYGELSVSDVCRVTVCDLRLTWRELFTASLGQCTADRSAHALTDISTPHHRDH